MTKQLFLFIGLLLLVLLLPACNEGDSGDGDRSDGDTDSLDGDESSLDGDSDSDEQVSDGDVDGDESETDGDIEPEISDGDSTDGDEADGDVADGDEDVDDIESEDEIDVDLDPLACPGHPEMVKIDDTYCIDRFEAVLSDDPDCEGTFYGQWEEDYPDGFPECVECVEDGWCLDGSYCPSEEWGQQTIPLYACSIVGYIPARFITWYRANKACENSGKQLCSHEQWVFACSGPDDLNYPYGDEYVEGACWDSGYGDIRNEPGESGMREDCQSSFGVFDLSGNLREWLVDGSDALFRTADDPFFISGGVRSLECSWAGDGEWRFAMITGDWLGFRCCLSFE